jgi:hypothetical protein
MKQTFVLLLLALSATSSWAAVKPCEELKQEIETKIQATGATRYTLEIVDKDEVQDPAMVVGSCDGGARRIIYQRNDG